MTINECCASLKKHIIEDLRLEHISIDEIKDDSLLFDPEGLGLDSLDAVELVVIVDKRFGVKIEDPDEARAVFVSPLTLATYIMEKKQA